MAKGPQLTQRKIDKLRDALNVVRETDQLQKWRLSLNIIDRALRLCDTLDQTLGRP